MQFVNVYFYGLTWPFSHVRPTKLHIAVNKSKEGMNMQNFKYRRVAFGQKIPSNDIDLVAREIRTNRKKWHEESGLNLKIKETSGYFCGQKMLSYVVATKISHIFDFQNFLIFLVSNVEPPA